MTQRDNTHSDLDALLNEVPSNEAQRLREVWHLAGDEEPIDFPDAANTNRALDRLRATMGHAPPNRTDRAPRAHRKQASWHERAPWRSAAAALLVLLIGVLGIYWWQRPITHTVPRGEQLAVTLPDGSEVELNSGSTLRYRRRFGDERIVRLQGEAFFDVTTEEHPFVVQTFNADVRVLGTTFNVRAWSEGELGRSTLVTLLEGRITLTPHGHPDRAVALTPGETRRVDTSEPSNFFPPVDLSIDEVTAWRRGDLVFKDDPLGAVLREVERRFAVDLTVQPITLQRQRINLALRQPADAEAVVRDLALALELNYRETANGYALYRQPPE